MVSSKIEDFTSYYVVWELISWTDLSVNELVEQFCGSDSRIMCTIY